MARSKLVTGAVTLDPAAAPPAVAPARELAETFLSEWLPDLEVEPEDIAAMTQALTTLLAERDRASRSPGAPFEFHLCCDEAYWLTNAAGLGCGQTCHVHGSYRWDKPNCAHCGVDASDKCNEPTSALRGQEGCPRPGSEAAGKEAESHPLSGLDAATVEACAREVEHGAVVLMSEAGHFDTVERARKDLAKAVRALATPPGQAKP